MVAGELAGVKAAEAAGARLAVSKHWELGGEGAEDFANVVIEAAEEKPVEAAEEAAEETPAPAVEETTEDADAAKGADA